MASRMEESVYVILPKKVLQDFDLKKYKTL